MYTISYPSMSKNIIANHIRDGIEDAIKSNIPDYPSWDIAFYGIEDAIKSNIPRRVIRVIAQHHGTSLMNYFYEKHKDQETISSSNGNSGLIESHFRYQTKKPQSREASILMLADSSEAAVRSI